MKRIVIAPGFGAGWATWAGPEKQQAVAEYQPIIDYLEAGGDSTALGDEHPLVQQMKADLDIDYFYTGGKRRLEIVTVDGPYMIEEYDGYESIRTAEDFWS